MMTAIEILQAALDNDLRIITFINDGQNPQIKGKYLAQFFVFPVKSTDIVLTGEGDTIEQAILDIQPYFEEYGYNMPPKISEKDEEIDLETKTEV